ncbi:GNAT family N-acetyltransferase [Brevundimonas balnearis]|uniref:GNAT family N-acetyltransferase n=1 Tax=Brevundimonas balnearis TaxID=1572858 RepID=A0ABV6R3T4_9CAUL
MSLYAPEGQASPPVVRLRPATAADAATLAAWDLEPHVIACSSDDALAEVAFGGIDWTDELTNSAYELTYVIAEVEGRPVGVMAVCDPHTEPSHYWGEIEPDLRAIDIWIGPPEWLGRGVGTSMMTQMIDRCFAEPGVEAIVIDPLASNTAAIRFYQRLGFVPEGRRMFAEDDCLVHRLDRADWAARKAVAA